MQIETIQRYKTLTRRDLESLAVLVVDDEPMVRETLDLFFQNLGILNIQTVDSGEKAVDEINRGRYDYVFMDLMMPGINGIETLKRIRESQQLTSVIIMTGYPSMDSVIEAMRNGASDFLLKPFRLQDIKISLERIQKFHLLMEKNWLLYQELEEKKEVEKLNNELQHKIRVQTVMYNIVDSLSRINRSEDLYNYLVKKSIESCNAKKACFMIYEHGNSNLMVLSQRGHEGLKPGTRISLRESPKGGRILDRSYVDLLFTETAEGGLFPDGRSYNNGFMWIPFNIRNQPFGVLIVAEKEEEKAFDDEDEFILMFLAERTALNIENMALYDNLMESLMASLMSLMGAIEAKDPYTQQHSSRVTEYSLKTARIMGCSHDDIQRLESISPIHDIGKIGIHDSILNKPGNLTEQEFRQIRKHPLIGVNIVSPLGMDSEEKAIIRNHHERWDGKGYPDGLRGINIPRLARILSVADAFDAMKSSRAYRKALPFSKCLKELRDNSGTQFDPEVVEAALTVFTG
ncbi:MAG: response regulator [Deltaproteobacteria bacterium]|nr:response regulator [Deltaproteobacteria bacterium]